MKHEFDPRLLADARLAELARRAATHLDAVSAGTSIPAHAQWRLPTAVPPGPPARVEVVVRDSTGVEETDWLREQDSDDNNLRVWIIGFWGDVLLNRIDHLHKKTVASLTEPEAVPA